MAHQLVGDAGENGQESSPLSSVEALVEKQAGEWSVVEFVARRDSGANQGGEVGVDKKNTGGGSVEDEQPLAEGPRSESG